MGVSSMAGQSQNGASRRAVKGRHASEGWRLLSPHRRLCPRQNPLSIGRRRRTPLAHPQPSLGNFLKERSKGVGCRSRSGNRSGELSFPYLLSIFKRNVFFAGFRPRATPASAGAGSAGAWSTTPNHDGCATRSEVQSHLSAQTVLAEGVDSG